jgi:hypothetical protein
MGKLLHPGLCQPFLAIQICRHKIIAQRQLATGAVQAKGADRDREGLKRNQTITPFRYHSHSSKNSHPPRSGPCPRPSQSAAGPGPGPRPGVGATPRSAERWAEAGRQRNGGAGTAGHCRSRHGPRWRGGGGRRRMWKLNLLGMCQCQNQRKKCTSVPPRHSLPPAPGAGRRKPVPGRGLKVFISKMKISLRFYNTSSHKTQNFRQQNKCINNCIYNILSNDQLNN